MYKIIGANNAEYGPVSAEQLRQWITEGRVNAQTLAQAAGETTWKPISSYPEFAANFPGVFTSPLPGATPQAPPPLGAPLTPDAGRARALEQVTGPAIGLIVVGALQVLGSIWGIGAAIFSMATGVNQFEQYKNMPVFQQNPQILHSLESMGGGFNIVMGIISIALAAFIIFAALKMKRLESYGMAIAASIIALLPCNCPCCCIGIPIGIWALVVLSKSDVKPFFT